MIDINTIRKAFSRANIIVSPNKLLVIYNSQNDWFVQDFDDTTLWTSLLKDSTGVSFYVKQGKDIGFSFSIKTPYESTLLFPALAPVGGFNIEDFIANIKPNPIIESELLAEIGSIELADDDKVIDGLNRWILNRLPKRVCFSLDSLHRFRLMKTTLHQLVSEGLACDIDIDNPDEYSDGAFTLALHSANLTRSLSGSIKDMFTDLVELSSSFGFEGNVAHGILRISFWV